MSYITLILVSAFALTYTLCRLWELNFTMASATSFLSIPIATFASTSISNNTTAVELSWHPPAKSWVNDLEQVLKSTGTHGFVFNGSQLPAGVPYGTYNWCNMPHVRKEEYKRVEHELQMIYVEV